MMLRLKPACGGSGQTSSVDEANLRVMVGSQLLALEVGPAELPMSA